MIRFYAYSGCDTCRQALKLLQSRGLAHERIAIREQPPTADELKRMLGHYHGDLRRLFNTSGQAYRELGLGPKLAALSIEDALALLAGNGNLVKRPFALTRTRGVAGFRAQEWARFLEP